MAPTNARLDKRFSRPGAEGLPWERVSRALAEAELYWLTTVRPDGRPHVCPLVGQWREDRFWFTTGDEEQKVRNLDQHDLVAVTTGANAWAAGLDVVVEGRAVRTTDGEDLRRTSEAFAEKYAGDWDFEVRGEYLSPGGDALAGLYLVTPSKVLAFGKDPHSQTSYRFG